MFYLGFIKKKKKHHWKMQHFIHFNIKFQRRQKYRQHTGMFVVAQTRRALWDHKLSEWSIGNLNTNCAATFAVFTVKYFLRARPKMINSNSQTLQTCGCSMNPSSLPTLTKCLLKFANLGQSSCLCWNMNFKGTHFRSLCLPNYE